MTSGKESISDLPVACSLPEPEFRERERVIVNEICRGALGVEELADGYAFTFPGDDERVAGLVEFVMAERRCCPFFTFELLFEPCRGPIHLRVRGPEGTRALIKNMLESVDAEGGP